MCGIAGIVSTRGPASAGELGLMTSLVTYRGPDDHGYLGYDSRARQARFSRDTGDLGPADGRSFDVLLGHRRLSILDLSEQGRCPMASRDGRLWITYNGEIYNYLELRRELEGLGHQFASGTDTEVILAAYRQWGVECLGRFNGMWAFALLDMDRSRLFCARDRLGVKPFYYHWDGRTFSFGSEIKQLLALPRVSREAHPGVLFDFLVFSTYGCNSEQTFFRDVLDMRGGHYLMVPLDDLAGWSPEPVRWWDIDLRHRIEGWSDSQYAERYRELFEDAVRLRLRSDVPLGTCLSGGLDSSGIVCMVDRLLAAAGGTEPQKTFTAVADNPEFDERAYAQVVIDATRVEPSFVNPSSERLLRDLDKLLWHQDEPFVSTSIFAGWCVYGLAREQGVTVTLDGQGPDEMLGGYVPMMYPSLLLDDVRSGNLRATAADVRGIHDVLGRSYGGILRDFVRELGQGRLPPSLMPSLQDARLRLTPAFFAAGLRDSIVLHRLDNQPDWSRRAGGSRFDQKLYKATFRDSLPGILRQVDRNSMAFSIESRLPFLDYRLVEFSFALPQRQKFEGGVAKQVYRRALSGILPDAIRDRRSKLGFVTTEADWVRGPARAAFAGAFSNIAPDAPYRREYVQKLFERIASGSAPYDNLLWRVFSLERMRTEGHFTLDPGLVSPPSPGQRSARFVHRTPGPGERPLRVCSLSPGVVHAVPRTVALARHLPDVHFIDISGKADPGALAAGGVHYHDFTAQAGRGLASQRLRRMLTEIDPDVICCHYGLGDHFRNAIAWNGCPVTVIAMGTDVLHHSGDRRLPELTRVLSRMGWRRVARISAKSRFLAEELRRIGVTAPVDINFWGCDLGLFQPGDGAAARAALGLPSRAPVILSPRALEPRLNIDLIVEAFPTVLARWPEAVLVVLGRADRGYEAHVHDLVARLGIEASVRFGGKVDARTLARYYVASDLVVSVARSEGFPNSVLEAMACGVPVVAGDIPQLRELLVHGRNAWLTRISALDIAQAMGHALDHPEEGARLGAAGRETALGCADIDANARQWAAELRAVAAEGEIQGAGVALRYRLALRFYQVWRLVRRSSPDATALAVGVLDGSLAP